jgi:hypothetical protein
VVTVRPSATWAEQPAAVGVPVVVTPGAAGEEWLQLVPADLGQLRPAAHRKVERQSGTEHLHPGSRDHDIRAASQD